MGKPNVKLLQMQCISQYQYINLQKIIRICKLPSLFLSSKSKAKTFSKDTSVFFFTPIKIVYIYKENKNLCIIVSFIF